MTTFISRPVQSIRPDPLTAARTSLAEYACLPAADSLAWSMALFSALRKLSKVFEEHVSLSSGSDGVLPEMLALKPHLHRRVRTLKVDHDRIREKIHDAMGAVQEQVCSPEIDIEKLRLLADAVVQEVRRYEAKGNELLYEALHRVDGFD